MKKVWRANALGIGKGVKSYMFRATEITRFLEDGGKLDDAQDIADHSDSSTTVDMTVGHQKGLLRL